jgi:cytochrome c553
MLGAVMSSIFSSSERKPCRAGKSYTELDDAQTREVMRNWLACGAPFVEANGEKLERTSAAGKAGDQYLACEVESDEAVTLESLFKSTFSECGGCHNSSIAGPPSFLDVKTLAKSLRTKSKCAEMPFVTPGNPKKSYLLELLKGPNPDCDHEQMPAGGLDPLSDRAIAEVEAWIERGAPTTARDLEEPDDAASEEPEQASSSEDE